MSVVTGVVWIASLVIVAVVARLSATPRQEAPQWKAGDTAYLEIRDTYGRTQVKVVRFASDDPEYVIVRPKDCGDGNIFVRTDSLRRATR